MKTQSPDKWETNETLSSLLFCFLTALYISFFTCYCVLCFIIVHSFFLNYIQGIKIKINDMISQHQETYNLT